MKKILKISAFSLAFLTFTVLAESNNTSYQCPGSITCASGAGVVSCSGQTLGNDPVAITTDAYPLVSAKNQLIETVLMPNNATESTIICVYGANNTGYENWSQSCENPYKDKRGNTFSNFLCPTSVKKIQQVNCHYEHFTHGPLGSHVCSGSNCIITCGTQS